MLAGQEQEHVQEQEQEAGSRKQGQRGYLLSLLRTMPIQMRVGKGRRAECALPRPVGRRRSWLLDAGCVPKQPRLLAREAAREAPGEAAGWPGLRRSRRAPPRTWPAPVTTQRPAVRVAPCRAARQPAWWGRGRAACFLFFFFFFFFFPLSRGTVPFFFHIFFYFQGAARLHRRNCACCAADRQQQQQGYLQ